MPRRRARYRTGDTDLDAAIDELVEGAGVHRDQDLVFEMVVSALRMGREAVDRAELKLVNAALKELRYSFMVFEPYAEAPKVAIFGSARITPDDAAYEVARDFGEAMAEAGWMVITGAGPGIMEAGIEGAGADRAFGVNILLPFESTAASVIADDPKLINYKYFFTRKITFMRESAAFALLPGGFGTMDEAFELLTLMQTGRAPIAPVVLMEAPGGTYWATWEAFVRQELLARGLVSDDDLGLVHRSADIDDAVRHITDFYAVYHSQRFVGQRLVLRLRADIEDALLEELNEEFADICVTGGISRAEASEPERADDDVVELPRLSFRFDRASYGRLRALIDRLSPRAGASPPSRPSDAPA